MIVKLHKHQGKVLLSVCDEELLDKIFEDGEKQIDLTVDFYKGDKATKTEASDLMRNVDYLNLVGEKSVNLALEEDLIEEDNIVIIDDIPTAQAIITRN